MRMNLPLDPVARQCENTLIGILWHEFLRMGLRGPKPVEIGLLTTWEFEFYKAFRLLRDGTSLPAKSSSPTGLSRQELRSFIGQLKQMAPEHYWLTTQRLTAEMGHSVNLSRPPMIMDRWWAERQKEEEIHFLKMELHPPGVEALDRRRKIWDDLIEADTYARLRKACGRWAQLSDVRRSGTTRFPRYVLLNAAAFLFMKQDSRFPRSTYSDDSRVDYLARGMAGVLCGVSPMTGLERLRNMKHDRNGPLWVTREGDRPVAGKRAALWVLAMQLPEIDETLTVHPHWLRKRSESVYGTFRYHHGANRVACEAFVIG